MKQKKIYDQELIARNRKTHDIVAQFYDTRHIEIYNPTEQKRISEAIRYAFSLAETDSASKKVFDFGAGTGNLTKHMIDLGTQVVAGDLSKECLKQLKKKFSTANQLQTVLLNGTDLSMFKDDSFDMAATYSVLHHVPDYIKAVKEMIRIVRPGGIIYIDHEAYPEYWLKNNPYLKYLKKLGSAFLQSHLIELEIENGFRERDLYPKPLSYAVSVKNVFQNFISIIKHYLNRIFLKKTVAVVDDCQAQPHIVDEGDIHVTKADHIDWEKIADELSASCEILVEKDYLVCRETEPRIWKRYKDKCVDIRMIIARKSRQKMDGVLNSI